MSKISAYTEIGGALADSDLIPLVDVSNTSMAASGTTRKVLLSRIYDYIIASIPIAWGTWTPTITMVTNLDAVGTAYGYYARVGSIVVFAVLIDGVDPTAASSLQLDFTLPVASNFTSWTHVRGVASGSQYSVARLGTDTTNDRATVLATSSGTGPASLQAIGAYLVL